MRRLAVAVLVLSLLSSPLPAQPRQDVDTLPPLHREALHLLAVADTVGALEKLRELTERQSDYGPGWLLYGKLLTATASEVERVFGTRLEAREALERAYHLMPGDPFVLLEYGLLLRRQGVRVDAARVLERVMPAAEKRGVELSAIDRARMHYALGKIYEAWWEDWEGMVPIKAPAYASRVSLPVGDPAIAGPEALAVFAVTSPGSYWELMQDVPPIADLKDEEYHAMLDHFRAAHRFDPGNVDAAVALLARLADVEAWEEFVAVARRLELVAPDDPRTHLFVGLGLHERGHGEEADLAFSRALALLRPDERRVFQDISALLRRSVRLKYAEMDSAGRADARRAFFAALDPIYLTPANERRAEHFARLAMVELKFGAPRSGLRGWETDRGQIWVRYGRPAMISMCCFGNIKRQIIWSYGERGPNFAFEKTITYRRGRFTPEARELANLLTESVPEIYKPRTVTSLHDVPHQLARFRGSRPDLVRVEVYPDLPLDSLGARPGDELDAGIFVFDALMEPALRQPHQIHVTDEPLRLVYRFEVPAGRFTYGIEARRPGPDSIPRPLARARERFDAEPFAGRLAISDLLLAHEIAPVRDAPARRGDLAIVARRGTTLAVGEPLVLYFEIYGLAADEDGLGRYRAELAVEDTARRGVFARVVGGLRGLLGGEMPEPRVQWERTTPLDGDQAMDYLSIQLSGATPGEYVVRITVTDLATGEKAETTRGFRITSASARGGGGP